MIPAELLQAPYLSLTTYRKTGVAVSTPVWFAEDGRYLYIFSASEAGKVKRLRNSSRAQVTHCSFHGKLLGAVHKAEATLLEGGDITAVHSLFRQKYGWQMTSLDFFSRLGGRLPKRAYIRVQVL